MSAALRALLADALRRPRPRADGVLERRQGVVVGDEVEALALVLQGDVLADRAEVVAQVQLAGRLHAAEDAFWHGSSRPQLLYPAIVALGILRAGRARRWAEHGRDRPGQRTARRSAVARPGRAGRTPALPRRQARRPVSRPGRRLRRGGRAAPSARGCWSASASRYAARAKSNGCALAPRGVEFLHERESPIHALHEMRATLRANKAAVPLWLDAMRAGLREAEARLEADAAKWTERLTGMERRVNEALRRLEAATPLVPPEVIESHPWAVDALNYLDRRRSAGAAEACELPELFAAVAGHHAGLSLPAFHDGLRRLHQRRAVRLRPADDAATMRAAGVRHARRGRGLLPGGALNGRESPLVGFRTPHGARASHALRRKQGAASRGRSVT